MKQFFKGCKTQTEKENRVKNIIMQIVGEAYCIHHMFGDSALQYFYDVGMFNKTPSTALKEFLCYAVRDIERNEKVMITIGIKEVGNTGNVTMERLSLNGFSWSFILQGECAKTEKNGLTVVVEVNGDIDNGRWRLVFEEDAYKIAA